MGVHNNKLRYFSQTGELIPTLEEAAIQAKQQVEETQQQLKIERQEKESALARIQSLEERLRAPGIQDL